MGQFDEQLKQAMAEFKAGRKAEARSILMGVVDQDERHEQAWLLLSGMVETLDEQQICLENVLEINPTSEKALKGLELLKQKRAGQPPAPASSPTFSSPFASFDTPSAPPTRGSSTPIGAEDIPADFFSSLPTSSPSTSSPFPSQFNLPADDEIPEWFSGGGTSPSAPAPAEPDPFAIPTSVDWGRTDKPAAYGSGRQVELPSAQEYDEWVQNLNLGSEPPATAPASTPSAGDASSDPFGGAAVFGDTSFMVDSGPFVADEPSEEFSSSVFEASWGNTPSASSARSAAPLTQGPFSSYEEEDTGPVSPFSTAVEPSSAAYESPDEESLSFSFDDDNEPSPIASAVSSSMWDDDFESAVSAVPGLAAASTTGKAAAASQHDYYRYIPDEIQIKSGGFALKSLLLMAGIVVMLLANVVSLVLML